MIEKYQHDINGISIYIDDYQQDNNILKGRKQDSVIKFMIMNRKTAERLYNIFLIKERIKKIEKIKNIIHII